VAGAAGSLVVLAAVGVLLHEALTAPAAPPRITLEVDSIVRVGSGYLVEFHATNGSPTTAAALRVSGELRDASGAVETSDVTLDYVPAQATRAAGIYFSHDPRRYRLDLRPVGYARP
jgi:uncharacterized protein (TIGR02588 family)